MIRTLPTLQFNQSINGIEHLLLEIEVCNFAIRSLMAHIDGKILHDVAVQVTEELGGNIRRIRRICDEMRAENGRTTLGGYGNPSAG